MKRDWWTPKLRAARGTWAALRPQERLSRLRPRTKGFDFSSTRIIGPGLKLHNVVKVGRIVLLDQWRIVVDMTLEDERVDKMVEAACGCMPDFLDLGFDLHSALNFLDGKDNDWSPSRLDLEKVDDQVAEQLKIYSAGIDRLWRFVGGCDVEGAQQLTLWALRNAGAVDVTTTWRGISAAFIYGDVNLAERLIRRFQDQYEEHVAKAPGSEYVRNTYVLVQPWFGRLRQLMGLPPSA